MSMREKDHLAVIIKNLDLQEGAAEALDGGSAHLDAVLGHRLEETENETGKETEAGQGSVIEIGIETETGTGTATEAAIEIRTEIQIGTKQKRATRRVRREMMGFLYQRKRVLVVCWPCTFLV